MIWGMDSTNLCQEKSLKVRCEYISNALAMRGTDCVVFLHNIQELTSFSNQKWKWICFGILWG